MKKNTGFLIFLFYFPLALYAQQDTAIVQRIILFGDGGELKCGRHPVTEAVRKTVPLNANTTVLILGDNIYKKGLPPHDIDTNAWNHAKKILDAQLSIADNTKAKVFVIPGNHDWNGAKEGGREAIKRQQVYVDSFHNDNVKFYPEGGCPGPVEISLGDHVTVILFDSQWWLYKHKKPGEDSACACDTKDELVKKIGEIAERNKNKLLIIASHHPFRSKGPHGGYYTLKQHIFPLTEIKKWIFLPLPVIGSIYPLLRAGFGVVNQDLKNKNYRAMISGIENAVRTHPNVIFVAGHEHGLQLLKDKNFKNFNYIVSGGASKTTRVNEKKTEFGSPSTGFAVLEISTNKNVTLKFFTVKETVTTEHVIPIPLLNFSAAKQK